VVQFSAEVSPSAGPFFLPAAEDFLAWSSRVREEIDLQPPVRRSRLRIMISFSFFLRWIPCPVPALGLASISA
jgi:DNA-binding transcriptional LysR family regulator